MPHAVAVPKDCVSNRSSHLAHQPAHGEVMPGRRQHDREALVFGTVTCCAACHRARTSHGSSDVATVLRAALLALQKAHPVMLRVGLHEHVAMVAPPPSPPPPRLAAAEGAMPPPPTLRPHRALLPLDEPAKVERELPSDASPHIMRVMNVANPLRSLQQVADETGTTIKMLFRVAEHLRTWGKVRFIHPLAEHSVLRIHPDASRDTPATEFRHLFGESEPSFAKVFKLFASAQSFGDVVRVSELIPVSAAHASPS